MAAKTSQEMHKARELIESGIPIYEAAKQAGISASAIYHSKWYKDRKAQKAS